MSARMPTLYGCGEVYTARSTSAAITALIFRITRDAADRARSSASVFWATPSKGSPEQKSNARASGILFVVKEEFWGRVYEC